MVQNIPTRGELLRMPKIEKNRHSLCNPITMEIPLDFGEHVCFTKVQNSVTYGSTQGPGQALYRGCQALVDLCSDISRNCEALA